MAQESWCDMYNPLKRSGKKHKPRTGMREEERVLMRDKGFFSTTDKLVASLRLRKIEREHTSVGSLLDTRTMFELDDPEKFRPTKVKTDKSRKRENIFGLSSDKLEMAETAEKIFKEKELTLQKMGMETLYSTEELIWKSKANAPDYLLKRQFERIDLVKFFSTIKVEQRKKFKKQCRERLFEICEKLRSKCNVSYNNMSDVFHPDANAHRAHCMYIMKLYKYIKAENIEDLILEKLLVIKFHVLIVFLFCFNKLRFSSEFLGRRKTRAFGEGGVGKKSSIYFAEICHT